MEEKVTAFDAVTFFIDLRGFENLEGLHQTSKVGALPALHPIQAYAQVTHPMPSPSPPQERQEEKRLDRVRQRGRRRTDITRIPAVDGGE